MDSVISEIPKSMRSSKVKAFFNEIEKRVELSDAGEIYITWKGTSVQMKFSQWIKSETLTNGENR